MNPPGGNFVNGVVWYTVVFKVSAFYFLGHKLATLVENPKLNPAINVASMQNNTYYKITITIIFIIYENNLRAVSNMPTSIVVKQLS